MPPGSLVPSDAQEGIDSLMGAVERHAPGQLAALYAVGSLALRDFTPGHSNIDVLVVTASQLGTDQLSAIAPAHRALRRARRDGCVCYATWADVADGPGPGVPSYAGRWPAAGGGIATPMTWAILRQDPVALRGPDWPVVWHDDTALRRWCAERLGAWAGTHGALLLRQAIGPVVLEAARLAHGASTGRVLSKSEAADAAAAVMSGKYRRVLADSLGYRRGARTSMYWGPFERRSDARDMVRELAASAGVASN